METTRLSTKGQIILPKSIRDARTWGPGTEFSVEQTADGVLLRPSTPFARTRIAEVAGCLKPENEKKKPRAKTDAQIRAAIDAEVNRRYERGRY